MSPWVAILSLTTLLGCPPQGSDPSTDEPDSDTVETDVVALGELVAIEIVPSAVLLTTPQEVRDLVAFGVDADGNRTLIEPSWTLDGDNVTLDGAQVVAEAALGSAVVTATHEGLTNIATIAVAPIQPGVLPLPDEDIASWTIHSDAASSPTLRFDFWPSASADYAVGDLVVSSGQAAISGRIISEEGDYFTVEAVPLAELFEDLSLHLDVPLETDSPSPARRSSPWYPRADCKLGGELLDLDLLEVDVNLQADLRAVVDIDLTPVGLDLFGTHAAVVEGSLVGDISIGHTVEVGLEGEIKCAYLAGEATVPIFGPFSVFFSPTFPYGAGLTLKGEVEGGELEVVTTTPVNMDIEMGFYCSPLDGVCDWVADFNREPLDWTTAWTFTNQLGRQALTVDGYVMVNMTGGWYAGTVPGPGGAEVPLSPLSAVTLQELKVGMRAYNTWAPMGPQLADDDYRAHGWIGPFHSHKAGFDIDVSATGIPDWFADLIDVDFVLIDETYEFPPFLASPTAELTLRNYPIQHGQTGVPELVITFDQNTPIGALPPIEGVFVHDVGDIDADELTPLTEWGATGAIEYVWPIPLDRGAEDQDLAVFYQWDNQRVTDRLEVSNAGYIEVLAFGSACDNHIDEDGDGWVDDEDPDCSVGSAEVGFEPSFECNDGVDNDGVGGTDASDEQCERADGVEAAEADCTDGLDNDLDTDVDCMDWDCLSVGNQCWCAIYDVDPDSAAQTTSMLVTLEGDNFGDELTAPNLSFGPGIVVSDAVRLADYLMEATVAVSCDAPVGVAQVQYAQSWEPPGTDCASAGRACLDGFEVIETPGCAVDEDGDGWCPGGVDLDEDGLCAGADELWGYPTGPTEVDCDDEEAAFAPGSIEDCADGLDADCDGLVDQADVDCLLHIAYVDPLPLQAETIAADIWGDGFQTDGGPPRLYAGPDVIISDAMWVDATHLTATLSSTCDAPAEAVQMQFAQPWEANGTPCTSSGRACFDLFEVIENPDCDIDVDGDGIPAAEDCDDTVAGAEVGAEERCDGVDNNCDQVVDEGCTGPTDHSGVLAGDEIWIEQAGPHRLTGDVTVPVGVTLTIEPGVTVTAGSGDELFVEGTMWALGTEDDPVCVHLRQDHAHARVLVRHRLQGWLDWRNPICSSAVREYWCSNARFYGVCPGFDDRV